MKVLVPVDGSDHAERAVRFAARLAQDPARLRIVLLNVQPAPSDVDTLHMAQKAILEHLRARGEDTLGPARKLTDSQKKQLAEIDSIYKAKIADLELSFSDKIAAARAAEHEVRRRTRVPVLLHPAHHGFLSHR